MKKEFRIGTWNPVPTTWSVTEMTGYRPVTTFWEDFGIAERFGFQAIKDTYNNAFENWGYDTMFMTEIVMVLNWKTWQWSESNVRVSRFYQKLWEEADKWCMNNMKDEHLQYYLRVTD